MVARRFAVREGRAWNPSGVGSRRGEGGYREGEWAQAGEAAPFSRCVMAWTRLETALSVMSFMPITSLTCAEGNSGALSLPSLFPCVLIHTHIQYAYLHLPPLSHLPGLPRGSQKRRKYLLKRNKRAAAVLLHCPLPPHMLRLSGSRGDPDAPLARDGRRAQPPHAHRLPGRWQADAERESESAEKGGEVSALAQGGRSCR